MITECARCGHTIDTNSEDGQAQGITRAWQPGADGEPGSYVDFHKLCRTHDIEDQRRKARDQTDTADAPRRPGRPRKQPAAEPVGVVQDEM